MKPLSAMPADLNRRVTKIGKAIETSKRDTLRAAAMAAKEEHLDVMRGDAGGDLRLSRVRSGKGAKIGARFEVKPPTADIRAIGPVPLIANKIGPHRIPKASRQKVIAIPGIGVRAWANHPGTPGKDTWNRGRERAAPRVRTVIGKRTDLVVRRAFLSGG